MSINAYSNAVTNSLRVAVAVASTTAAELPREGSDLYFVTCTSATYVAAGGAAVAAASTTEFTYFFPAGFWGIVRIPGEYVRAIRDTADGTMVLTAVRGDTIAT